MKAAIMRRCQSTDKCYIMTYMIADGDRLMHTVLVVDDDYEIRTLMAKVLQKYGFRVLQAANTVQADKILLANKEVDLILLDIMMPSEDGMSFCKRIIQKIDIPVIMLTAVEDEVDQILCIELGVVDYILKPFNPRILIAKIKNFIKFNTLSIDTPSMIQFGDWKLNTVTQILISPEEETIGLGHIEFCLLKLFLSQPNKVLSRSFILNNIHQREYDISDRSIDITVSRLRDKLQDIDFEIIRTIHRRGYLFYVEDVEFISGN